MNKIKGDIQKEILQRAIQAFRKNVLVPAEIEMMAQEPLAKAGLRPDYLIRILIKGQILNYYAEEKVNFTEADKLILLMYREKLDKPLLLVANYINPRMADQLKQDGLEFIDTAGNAFINNPTFYVFVKGNKPLDIIIRPPLERAFKPAGLKIIFAFLCNPGLENKTYREIAGATGVALGTINRLMKDLMELGFLLDMGKRGRKLTQKEDLLHRWVTAYPVRLRPKLILGCYRGETGWWEQRRLGQWGAQWGGEVAAAKWTHYLKPELKTIYAATRELNQLLLGNRLKRDIDGDVEILARFWKVADTERQEDWVHPILVYADLVATGNQRNIETAKMIYEQQILRLIRED
jgi:hypothetical protein